MKHVLLIDPLEKLNFKKDSTLMLAMTMKKRGIEVYLLFEKDFYIDNKLSPSFLVYNFEGDFYQDGCYLKSFSLINPLEIKLLKNDIIHMRIDPPFDTRYLRYLWMLRFLKAQGIEVMNSPDGILKFNEKLHAYSRPSSLPSFVGSSVSGFLKFVELLKGQNNDQLIFKPLDLFQGIGVEKISIENPALKEKFEAKVLEYNGPIVVQPYCQAVTKGEIRAIYFKGKELGSILKIPKAGEFLANIAQGADFHPIFLDSKIKQECDIICAELVNEGVDWVAFDILGEHISEINITCPGLLVEVSFAHQKNLAKNLIDLI